VSSPPKSDSGRPPSPQSTPGKELAETKVPSQAPRKPTLAFPAVVQTEHKSEPPSKHDSRKDTQYMAYRVTPVPTGPNLAPPAVTPPTGTDPRSPFVAKSRQDSSKSIAVPIKHISDKPQPYSPFKRASDKPSADLPKTTSDIPSVKNRPTPNPEKTISVPIKHISDRPPTSFAPKRDSGKPLAGQIKDNGKPSSEPPRRAETAAIKPAASASNHPVPSVEEQESGTKVSLPPSPTSAPPALPSIEERNGKLNKVIDSYSQEAGKKKKNARRKKRYEQTAIAESAFIPSQEHNKAIGSKRLPPRRSESTVSIAKWVLIGGLLSLSIAAIYWSTTRRPAAPPLTRPVTNVPPPRQHEPVPQGPTTEIVTNPPGAEVVSEGTVIGTSPTKIERSLYEQLVLLRKTGYEPTLLRMSISSPPVIQVDLKPSAETPKDTATNPVPVNTKSSPRKK
jgi:hypothetical protein